MALYELRTYQVTVGKMKDVVAAYNDKGWPALQAGGFDKKLVGYFISDTGPLHQVVHL
ncbi:MAG: NIPSNAP family protein, partial [Candidatus Puniceispirillum sp.]